MLTERAKYLVEKIKEVPDDEIQQASYKIAGIRMKIQNYYVQHPEALESESDENVKGDFILGILHALLHELRINSPDASS